MNMLDVIEYKDARYNEDGSIECQINHPQTGWVGINLNHNDSHTQGLYNKVEANGDIEPYVEPKVSLAELRLKVVRDQIKNRKYLLTKSDYKELPGYMEDHTEEENETNKKTRKMWRAHVRVLEAELKDLVIEMSERSV